MDVATAVGGAFLSAFLKVAFDRIQSSRNFIDFFQGKKDIKFDEATLDRLETTLDTISVVLEDAENKQAKSPAVRRWLDNLKEAVNQADDLLDELNTEYLRLKVDYQFKPKECKADSNVSDANLSLEAEFIEKLMPDLKKITDRLEWFVNQSNALDLQEFVRKEKCSYRVSSSSVVDTSQIFGRDEEREKLVQMVLSDEGGASAVSVIPITGMGGIGKTTLAQSVYNDVKVKDHFPTRAWVCVSEEYDALRITKDLLMEVNSDIVDDNDNFNRMQVKLRDNLVEKCFLIILDDVWNENYNDWHSLKNPLNHGSRGSKIIITTRNETIALMMQNEPFHHMQPMPEDQSWSLFKSHAFDNGECTLLQEFEIVGKEIVKKCKGLPLAIKTIAGALRPKRDINEWHDILSSETWAAKGDILPALNLSYKHLPSHLKCCFSFCAVFPKDIPFDKKEVILMWMANDLVHPSMNKSVEEIGQYYFQELRSRSLFNMVDADKYLMHDLVNDLARHVSGNVCVRLQDYRDTYLQKGVQREINLPREVLHFSYLITWADPSRKFRALAKVNNLRTFLPIFGSKVSRYGRLTRIFFLDILPRLQRIRALTLSSYHISVVPDSIGDLKHLRFLNLAMTHISKLPNSIGKCLNLQTLILSNCDMLVELPEDMRRLINLRHLDVRSVGSHMIKGMDSWLSILKDIQNLTIIVDKVHGSVLHQLGKQLQPCQSLIITGLENVTLEIAQKAELKNYHFIKILTLEWSGFAESSNDELNMFSELQPHTNTEMLSINGYRGTTFPHWLGDFVFWNMQSLSLKDCSNCFFLPPLGQLNALKKLCISGLSKITEVGEEFYGKSSSSSKPFQALECLEFHNMAEWTVWNTHPHSVEFLSLQEFRITNCPKLVGDIPFHATSLREFEIRKLPSLLFTQEGFLPYSPSLQVAKISRIPGLRKNFQGINHLDKLEVSECPDLVSIPSLVDYLEIKDCPSVPSLSLQTSPIKKLVIKMCKHLEFPTSDSINFCLESLKIEHCGDSIEPIPLCSFSKLREVSISNWNNPKLFKFPNGYHQNLSTLQSLRIKYCDNILCFPEGGLHAPNLKVLEIENCMRLMSLPEQMHTRLSSLGSLVIRDCPEIVCFPEGGLPSSLETLLIVNCEKLMIGRNNWGLQRLSSLKRLEIGGVDDTLFTEEGLLPSSLRHLTIWECPNLEALDYKGLRHLTFLQSLYIYHCPNLRYLPEDGLPSSLCILCIIDCPKLKGCMEREKGEERHKVSHIPFIKLDWELIS